MAGKVVREFIIRVNSKGQIEAIRDYEKLDKALGQTARSAGETDRAMKGVAQATSNSTKSFAKQAQGLGGIVRIYATVAANVFALSSAYNVLKRNADLSILQTSSEQLSIATGRNYANVANALKRTTGGAITFREAMQSANLALSGGFSGTQANQIAEIATKAANALGRSVPEAVQRLTQAIVKGEPELADEFGIILRITEATRDYAKALGKLPTELTTAQKSQAVFNQFLTQGLEKFEGVEIQTNPYDKLAASFTEIIAKVTELVRLPLDPFINLIAENGIILAAIFAGIATKITKLAIPAIQELTSTIALNAAAYSTKAQDQYVLAQERVATANLAAADSFKDYKDILSAGLKGVDFSTIKKTATFDPEYLSAENIGDDITRNIKLAFKKSDEEILKFKDNILTKLQGVKIGSIIDIDGLKLSTTQARSLVEALELSTTRATEAARKAFENEIGTVNRLGLSLDVARAKAAAFGAQLKAAVAGQFSTGLTGGFIDNLKDLPVLFKENIKGATNFGGKFAGAMGFGSRALGTLLGGMTKLLGIFGPIGIAFSFAITALEGFSNLIGLTSDHIEKADEAIEDLGKTTDLLKGQVTKLKTIGTDTFGDLAKSAEFALNIIRNFEDDLPKVTEAFLEISRDLDNSLLSSLTGNEEEIFKVLDQLNSKVKILGSSLGETGKGFITGAKQQTVDLVEILKIDEEKFGNKAATQIIGTLKRKLGSSEFLKQEGNKYILSLGASFDNEEAREAISEILNDFFKLSEVAANALSIRMGEQLKEGLKTPKELRESVTAAKEAVAELNKEFSETTIKLQNSNPLYAQAVKLNRKLTEAFKESGETATTAISDVDPALLKTFEAALGAPITTLGNLVAGSRAFMAQQEKFDAGIQNSKAVVTAYDTALINLNEEVRKGNLAAITTQFETQRLIGLERIKQLKIERETLESQLAPLGDSAEVTSKRMQLLGQIAEKSLQISKTEADINVKYSEQQASVKINLESAKQLLDIEKTRLTILNDQKSVTSALSSSTGDIGAKQTLLNFERQITAQKIQQLNAEITSKQAKLADTTGIEAKAIQEQIKQLELRKGIERELLFISQSSGNRDLNIETLELENKIAQQVNSTREAALTLEKGLADVRAGDLFLSNQARDAAELLSLQKDIQLVEANRATINTDIELIQSRIGEEAANIARLRSQGYDVAQNTKRIQELQVELTKKENEGRSLAVDREKAITAEREKQFELAKQNASLFDRPQEFQNLLGENFRRAAEDFGKAMGSSIDRITNVTLGVIDSGIDAFVDAVAAGENALQAATTAMKDTFLQLNNDFIKDQFKKLARQGLTAVFGQDSGLANIGKSEELVEAEKQTTWLQKIFNAIKGGPGGILNSEPAKEGEDTASIFSNLTQWVQDTFTSVKDVFSKIGTNISDVIGDGIKGITEFIGNIDFSGIFNSISSALSGIGGGGGGGFADLASTAISLFFAKGGVTGEIMKRIPMYANGGVTSGPEIAMVGEGPKREAIVPLPDNRSIPVTINGSPDRGQTITNNINVTVTGVQGTEEGIRRSANQIAVQIAREQARAQGRIG